MLKLADAAIDFLTTEGYDLQFSTLPVKRAIQRFLLWRFVQIIAGKVDNTKAIKGSFTYKYNCDKLVYFKKYQQVNDDILREKR
ncbi:MAG: hypothetical protein LBS50_02570 [Prevotellaceae bacterium]|jgi:hypothetical protein|nr:hypothetical protein [Prevotellaceae bacterium]